MRTFGFRIALVLVSLAFGTVLLECGLRAAGRHVYRSEDQDWTLRIRMHHAGKDMPVDRRQLGASSGFARLRSDERGYLLPSRRFAEPDATIAFLGGSTTECAALDEDERYPAVVSKLFEADGLRVDVLNAGQSGATAHDAVNLLLNHVAQDAPDVVVLMEAANDIGVLARDPTYRTRSAAPMTVGEPARWLLGKLSSWSALVGELRLWMTSRQVRRLLGVTAIYGPASPPPIDPFERRLRAFVAVARALDMEPVLMTQPYAPVRTELTPDWLDEGLQARFNDRIRQVAAAEGVPLVDLERRLRESVDGWDRPMNVFYDGIHVTANGARVYAEFVTEQLRESIPLLRRPGVTPPVAARSR